MTYSKLFSMLVGIALIFSVQEAEAKGPQKPGEPDGFYECVENNLGQYSAFCPMSQPGFCPGMEKILKRTKAHLESEAKLSKKTIGKYLKNLDSLEKDWKTFFNNCMTKLANKGRVDAKDIVSGKKKNK